MMFTSAIISLMITNVVATSAAVVAAFHISFLFSAVTSAGWPREKGQTDSDILTNSNLRPEEEVRFAA